MAQYAFPLSADLRGVQVAEEDGEIIAIAGYEVALQIVAVVNHGVGPARRLQALKALHGAVAPAVLESGAKSVFSFCDPRFRGFLKRMMRMGWNCKLWPCLFLDRAEIEKAFG